MKMLSHSSKNIICEPLVGLKQKKRKEKKRKEKKRKEKKSNTESVSLDSLKIYLIIISEVIEPKEG
jgi:hypothetical protein